MNIENDISSFCTTEVVKTLLPMTQSLFGTSWLILAETRLIFSLVCAADIQELRSDPPFSIIDIPPGCAASNKYFTINTPFVVGRSNISERRSSDLINANFSDTAVWKPFREKFPNDTVIHLPPTLSEIDNMPLNSLLRELQMAKVDDSDPKRLWSLWSYVSLSLALVVVIIIILCCCKYKYALERAWLPEWLRNVWRTKQHETVPTEVELQTRETGRSLLPAVSQTNTNEKDIFSRTSEKNSEKFCSRLFVN